MNSFERETIVNSSDGDDLVRIWTAQRTYITRLRRHPAFTEVKSGKYEGTEWAEFTIPADRWSPVGARRSVTQSSEQRQASAERMRALRAGSDG